MFASEVQNYVIYSYVREDFAENEQKRVFVRSLYK